MLWGRLLVCDTKFFKYTLQNSRSTCRQSDGAALRLEKRKAKCVGDTHMAGKIPCVLFTTDRTNGYDEFGAAQAQRLLTYLIGQFVEMTRDSSPLPVHNPKKECRLQSKSFLLKLQQEC